MRLLLAGASGFIGRHLVDSLRIDHEVYGISRRPSAASPNRDDARWDATASLNTTALPREIDVVCYAASSYRHRDGPAGADDLFAVNTAGVLPLLNWAREVGASQFVYLSTGSVYGAGEPCEDARPEPVGFYGASKLAGEVLVGGFGEYFSVFIPRLYTPYGPGQRNRLVPTLIDRVSTGRAVELSGIDGLIVRPTFVDDIVAVLVRSIEERWTGIINVANPDAVTLRQLAEQIGEVVHKPPRFVAKETEPNAFDQRPDGRRLNERLGGSFRWTSLMEGLAASWSGGEG